MILPIRSIESTFRLPSQYSVLDEFRRSDSWCLFVFDACRFSAFRAVYSDFVTGDLVAVKSEGKNTFEYLRYCWPETYDLTYVTGGAPITAENLDFDAEQLDIQGVSSKGEALADRYAGYVPRDHFARIEEVWRESWDEELGVCPPEPVAETAIDIAREESKLVCHFFQPHAPFIGDYSFLSSSDNYNTDMRGGAVEDDIWREAQAGKLSRSELIRAHRSNLRRALEAATYVIHETEFDRFAMMADHGEALGEYGCYHHQHDHHPYIRKVPWFEIKSIRQSDLSIRDYQVSSTCEVTTRERLIELGYIEEG